MSQRKTRRLARISIAGVLAALVTAAVVLIGGAASPLGTAAVAAEYPKKVTICHRTGSSTNPSVTITVSRNALPAHLRHGDTIGAC
jgi:ABC-type sugar transport system substrate-binding protein